MTDTQNNTGRWQIPKPSTTTVLGVALAISLAFSGYLLSRPDVRAVIFAQGVEKALVASPTPFADLVQPDLANAPTLVSPDINTLMAQLQNMQSQMQAASAQLEQKYQAAGLPSTGNGAQAPRAGEDVAALWAEIEQLNQQMLPLMEQLEAASANRSSRPASEWFALRTRVNTIHQRLADLTARVEAAQARAANTGGNTAQWAAPAVATTNPNQAAYEQLYQNMAELQSLLHQMHRNGQTGP